MIDLYKCFLLFITLLQVMCIANRRCSDLNSTEHRIAIAFYGLSRNLKSTLPSIERHVFEVLDNNSIVYDVFWSSLDAAHVTNKRSGEKNLKLDEADFTLMRPCVISLVSQSVVAPIELILYKQARIGLPANEMDMFNDNLNSVQNLLAAFHSMRIASSMIAKYSKLNNITYDAVVVLRPDTAVITDIDLSQHLNEIIEQNRKYESEIENNSYPQPIWIPDFQHWEGYNDRAAYGSVRVMSRYMMRGIMFRDYVGVGRRFYPNGENYLKAYLHAYNITFQPSTLRVVRVRADESISHGDTLQKFMNMDNSTYASFVARCINNAHIHGPKFFNATNC